MGRGACGRRWRRGRSRFDLRDHDRQPAERLAAQYGRQRLHQYAKHFGSWLGWSPVGTGSGSGATPAVGSSAILADYNNYEFAAPMARGSFIPAGVYGQWSTWFPLEPWRRG